MFLGKHIDPFGSRNNLCFWVIVAVQIVEATKCVESIFERPIFFKHGSYSTHIIPCGIFRLLNQYLNPFCSHKILTPPTSCYTPMFVDLWKTFPPPTSNFVFRFIFPTLAPKILNCLQVFFKSITTPAISLDYQKQVLQNFLNTQFPMFVFNPESRCWTLFHNPSFFFFQGRNFRGLYCCHPN